jgi:DNA-binding NarL/FixJ family response regulator
MQILLVGKRSSITITVQTMLRSIDDWSAQLYSDLDNLDKLNEENANFDLLIVNLGDFSTASIKAVSQIHEQFPDTPLLVIHSYINKAFIKPILKAGALGYIYDDISEKKLVEAVRKVAQGTECIIAEST